MAPPSPERLAQPFAFCGDGSPPRASSARPGGDGRVGNRDAGPRGPAGGGGGLAGAAGTAAHRGGARLGKTDVRFGKGAKTSGAPAGDGVLMLDGVDLLTLRCSTYEGRARGFSGSAALFCD